MVWRELKEDGILRCEAGDFKGALLGQLGELLFEIDATSRRRDIPPVGLDGVLKKHETAEKSILNGGDSE